MQEDLLPQKEITQVFQDQELKKVLVVVEQVLSADLQHPVMVELVEQVEHQDLHVQTQMELIQILAQSHLQVVVEQERLELVLVKVEVKVVVL